MHIITPYNPWAPKKKKTWQEEIWEQQAIAEAEARMLAEASSKTLPQNSPDISVATAGPAVNAAAGAGGSPPPQFFDPAGTQANLNRAPAVVAAPAQIVFTNLTPNAHLYRFNWTFSDGQTSTELNPTLVFQTGSTAGYGMTASVSITNSLGVPGTRSPDVYTILSPPTVTALFTRSFSSPIGPMTASFTNLSTNTSQIPSTIYLWVFGDATGSALTNPTHGYFRTGSFTASLQATGSYNITSNYTQSFTILAPTVTALFTYTTSSNTAPATASFVQASTYNGHGSVTYLFLPGTGSLSFNSPTQTVIYTAPGKYTASLQMTESSFNITRLYTQSFALS
jgi:hypothetical protein